MIPDINDQVVDELKKAGAPEHVIEFAREYREKKPAELELMIYETNATLHKSLKEVWFAFTGIALFMALLALANWMRL